MGEHEGWPHPCGIMLNGLLSNETENVIRVIDTERWAKAEERIAELIACIQPNRPTEERRNAVANYVQRLIMKCISCEVFTFGSVPLKTYLPDGDIDLTAFSKSEDLKDTWANEVRGVLEKEENNENAEFRVKEVQYIHAEVKIIKCLVENIIVDISMDQVGGLCTLCFLEEIDNLINQNHLFKRSIILIKAWCYYESRILGAHHGLISTYALETLVLYIFHVFNNCFTGPLEVLYRFLELFSNFDWDNYCVSLWGPVPISSLPDIAAESPRKDDGDLLLSGVFLEACSSVYAVFPGGQETQSQPFVRKHFNVIDPLRTNNNLGRSVSKGNFYRIRSAFAFGAKRLARLLDCPKDDLIAEVGQFFMNTWERHGRGGRPDAPLLENRPSRPLKINAHTTRDSSTISRTSDHGDKKVQANFEFLRTQSSPELTEAYIRHGGVLNEQSKSELESRRKSTINHDSSSIQSARPSFEDTAFSHRNGDSGSASNSYQDCELATASGAFDLRRQEDQDMANTMASSRRPNYIGQVQIPMQISSSHPPIPLSPYPIATNYARNIYTIIDPSYGPAIPFPHGFVSPQFPHMMPSSDDFETGDAVPDENSAIQEDDENGGFETDDDERRHFPASRVGHITSSVMRGPRCFITGNKGNGVILTDRGASWRHPPMEHFARNDLPSESPRDGSNSKPFKQSRNKCGRSSSEAEAANSDLRETKGERQHEISSEPASSSQDDDENGSFHSGNRPSGYEQAQMSGTDSMISVAPLLVGGPRQRPMDASGVLPFTFYQTGPPVPFVTMVPVYNFPTNSDGSSNQVDDGASPSDQNFDPTENYRQFDALVNSNGWKYPAVLRYPAEHIPDVLNSDFASHWQNLQYGRFCQNSRSHGPISYAPIMVPPVYLQGHFPMDGPGRPHSANMGFFTQVMGYGPPRLVPVAPLQPVPGTPSSTFRRLADDSPRYRAGTGTYLPNPKASFRERQFSSTRNHRGGGYKHDRGDQSDREGSWINSKVRSAARNHLRIQNERPNFRSDNRYWDSYRQDHFTPHQRAHNASYHSSNTSNEPIIDHRAHAGFSQTGSGFNGGYGSPAEPLRNGSFGATQHFGGNEGAPRPGHGNHRQGSSRGGSSRSSPDQPSSPQVPK